MADAAKAATDTAKDAGKAGVSLITRLFSQLVHPRNWKRNLALAAGAVVLTPAIAAAVTAPSAAAAATAFTGSVGNTIASAFGTVTGSGAELIAGLKTQVASAPSTFALG